MVQDHNLKISTKDYRDLDLPSYSMLSSISKQGVDVVNGVKSNVFELKFGSLVDDMCFDTINLNKRYHLNKSIKAPTRNVKLILDDILLSIKNKKPGDVIESSGILKKKVFKVTSKLDDYDKQIITSARKLDIYKSYDDSKILQKVKHDGKDYFEDKMNGIGKMMIKPEMWQKAMDTSQTLITHQFTSKYFDHSDPNVEIIYQYKFISKVNGRKVKGMLDCVVVDHNTKQIFPVDLKTGESPVSKFKDVLLLHEYYIQGALYKEGLKHIVESDEDLKGYTVEDFEFVYISKMNPLKPIIYVMDANLHEAALNGFKDVYNYQKQGVYELLDLYYDCKEGRYCNYEREVYENEGRIMLNEIVKEKYEYNKDNQGKHSPE